MKARRLVAHQPSLRWLGDRSAASLAAIEAFLGLEFLAYAWLRSQSGEVPAIGGALAMLVLAVVTVVIGRWSAGVRLAVVLNTSLTIAWIAVAAVAASRYTPEGKVSLGMFVLVLAAWAGYALPGRIALLHATAMVVAYDLALLFFEPAVEWFFAVLVATVVLSLTVLMTRLRVVDARYRLLVENSADIVFHTSGGVLVWVSPSISGLLGWDAHELVGKPTTHLWHPDDLEHALALRDAVYSGATGEAVLRLRARDGRYLWVDVAMHPYVDARGNEGAVGSLRDVTARVEAEHAVEESLRAQQVLATRLEAVDRAKTRMFQNISHEFRTPLTMIHGPLQGLLRDASVPLSVRQRQDLEAALRAAERMQGLVDGLLEVARGEAGQLVVDLRPTDLPDLTRRGIAMFASAAEDAGLELRLDVDDFPPLVRADPELWTRVLLNLVSNAVKYTRRGGIHVTLSEVDGRARLVVADTGEGIAPDELPFVFERFSQTTNRPVRGDTGSGLGLALVKEIVSALGGTVDVTSTPHEGTTFVVELPAEECAAGDPGSTQACDVSPTATAEPQTVRDGAVLLVEDSDDLRGYLVGLIAASGWRVTDVADLESARPLVAEHDIVVSDVMLPDGSGVDLVRWVRGQPDTCRWMPVILLTAKADQASVLEGIQAGADDYIVKPFDPDELVARVATHMELALLRRLILDEADVRAADLQRALQSNRTIGTALGILMSSRGLTAEQAFDELRRASQNSNRKLRDIADEVTFTGALPAGL